MFERRNRSFWPRRLAATALLAGCFLSISACGDTSMNQAVAGTGGFLPVAGAGGAAFPDGLGGAGNGAPEAGTYAPLAGAGGIAGMADPGGTGGVIITGGTGGSIFTGETGGVGGIAGTGGTGGTVATGGTGGIGGAGGIAGTGGTITTGGTGGTGTGFTTGTCCADGNCLCHGPDPTSLTSRSGTYNVASYRIATGEVHYPTDAEPPLAAVALCGGFTNTGPEMASWGPFYASHGIVTVIVTTTGMDFPDIRANKLLAAIDELESENNNASSPLSGKLAGWYGTSGYSMGGGGTTIASVNDPSLRTSVGLAAWAPATSGISVPTLLLCGSSDGTAPCSMSSGAYNGISGSTPKMMISITGATHMSWFGPTSAGNGTSGEYALAFQKVYLEGDERWKPLLTVRPAAAADWQTTIQ